MEGKMSVMALLMESLADKNKLADLARSLGLPYRYDDLISFGLPP